MDLHTFFTTNKGIHQSLTATSSVESPHCGNMHRIALFLKECFSLFLYLSYVWKCTVGSVSRSNFLLSTALFSCIIQLVVLTSSGELIWLLFFYSFEIHKCSIALLKNQHHSLVFFRVRLAVALHVLLYQLTAPKFISATWNPERDSEKGGREKRRKKKERDCQTGILSKHACKKTLQ